LGKNQARVISEILKTSNIDELAQLDKDAPLNNFIKEQSKTKKDSEISQDVEIKLEIYKKKYSNLEINIKKAITLSNLIKQIDGETQILDKNAQKIIVVGLDNAGKTAIVSKVGMEKGIQELSNLEPTKGVNRQSFEKPNLDLFIWDFGGQKSYRDKYLKEPEKYFLQIDMLIYVIDVQDPERFDESFDYFRQILDILVILEEMPYILILIHKFDPDIKDDPKIKLNIELIKEKMEDLFKNKEYDFNYETYLSSIYSKFSKPEFSKYLKDIISTNNLTDPTLKKVEGLGTTLEEVMNAVIKLSESISEQLNEIDARLNAVESGAFHIAQSGVPIEIRTSDQIRETSEQNVRGQVLDELKDLFNKKKQLDH